MGLSQYAPPARYSIKAVCRKAASCFVTGALAPVLIGWAERRHRRNGKADFDIIPHGELYLSRYRAIYSKLFGIYVHKTVSDDDNRALHDHPYLFNVSVILRGCYIEIMPYRAKSYVGGDAVRSVRREAGDFVFRSSTAAHRLMLPSDREPCWSLFITGPRIRQWGFYCPGNATKPARWVPENEYRAKDDGGASVGAGCD